MCMMLGEHTEQTKEDYKRLREIDINTVTKKKETRNSRHKKKV